MNDTKNNVMTPSVKAKITWMNDDPQSAKKASASITIADSFVVNGLSVIESQKGLFVSMPQRTREKDGQKRYNELAHPITAEMRTAIVNAVLDSYSQTMAISQQYRNELGEQVFEKTCEFRSKNDLEAMGIKWINVNISPAQLMRFDLGRIMI